MNPKLAAGAVAVAAATAALIVGTSGPSAPSSSSAPALSSLQPMVGRVLHASTGTWGNGPTSYTYQWKRCVPACANIPSATLPLYIATQADVGATIEVTVTAANAQGSASQTSTATGSVASIAGGSITFEGTGATGTSQWTAIGGSAQCANYGQQSVNGRLRGNLYFVVQAGLPALQLLNSTDPDPVAWPLQSCNMTGPMAGRTASNPMVLPQDEYIGMAVYIPSDPTIPNSIGKTQIAEWHLTISVGSQPGIGLELFNNRVDAFIASGLYNGSSYQYSFVNHPLHAIPAGNLTLGAWNEIAFHVRWANDSSGAMQFYYRPMGGTWTASSALSGIPTVAHLSNGAVATAYGDNAPSNYGSAFTAPYSVFASSVIEGTNLTTVEAAMP